MAKDIISDLKRDHRNVEKLFARHRALAGKTGGVATKRKIFDEVRRELSIHAAAEEQVLYPAVREAFAGGERCADSGLEEHSEVKQTLAQMQNIDPAAGDFDRHMTKLMAAVEHHVKEEETQVFPRLRQSSNAKHLRELGVQLRTAKRFAPTRPHPLAPDKPPANVVAGMIAGAVDRLRDALSALTEPPPRSATSTRRRAKRTSSTKRTRSRKRTAGMKSRRARTTGAGRKRTARKRAAGTKSRAKRKSGRQRRTRRR